MKILISIVLLFLAGFTYGQQVFASDLIVQGSECLGIDCAAGVGFGFNTLLLKENNLRLHFDDTSTSAGFASNDWTLEANSSASGGTNHFAVVDATSGLTPFKILAGASSNSLFVHSTGRVGFGTDNPVTGLHHRKGDTPTMRLEQDGSSGFSPQTWDVAGNETNFFVRDVTNGSLLPFKIKPSSPTNSVYISSTGVGIRTDNPEAELHVNGDVLVSGNFTAVSDKRVKDEIKSIDGALDMILSLDGKTFVFNDDFPEMNLPQGKQYGLIAQEVEQVVPEVVNQRFSSIKDKNNEDLVLKGVNYVQLVPILINAVNEQETEIQNLQSQIKTLSAQLKSLSTQISGINHINSQLDAQTERPAPIDQDNQY